MTPPTPTLDGTRRIFLVATEESGDRLGANLMSALRRRLGAGVSFAGVGGRAMTGEGLTSLFPIEDLSIVGFAAVVRRLPHILRRISQTTKAVVAASPDMLVIIDSPDFTHRVARRVRAANPGIPIIDYVSPTVWAWRSGRARAMRRYIDHVLALLPFEPDAHRRLGGPPCTYVGHPLIEHIDTLRPDPSERARRQTPPPVLLVLPGSRRSEVRHHMAVFGEALRLLSQRGVQFEPVLPTTPYLRDAVTQAAATWIVRPQIVVGESENRAAFRVAHAALAKSGTVTLELAIAGVPMVAAYRVGSVEASILKRMVDLTSVILANLVVGANVVPVYLQNDCTPKNLASALADVLRDTPMRRRQIEAFARIDAVIAPDMQSPSDKAAEMVIALLR